MTEKQSLGDVGDSGRVRIYELAREIGVSNKELLAKVRSLSIDAKNHMSSVLRDDAARVRSALAQDEILSREVKRISDTVIRRRIRPRLGAEEAIAGDREASAEFRAPQSAESLTLDPGDSEVGAAPSCEQSIPLDLQRDQTAQMIEEDRVVVEENAVREAASLSQESEAEKLEEFQAAPTRPDASEAAQRQEERVDSGKDLSTSPVSTGGSTGSEPVAPTEVGDTPREGPDSGAAEPQKPPPRREIRYAPGFDPSQYRPPLRKSGFSASVPPAHATEAQPLSAADALKLLTPTIPRRKQQVVISESERRFGQKARTRTSAARASRGQRRLKKRFHGVTKQTAITTPAQHKRIIRVEGSISVGEVARQMAVKSAEVLSKLWSLGLTNVRITHELDVETASLLASEFGYGVEDVSFKEADLLADMEDRHEDLVARAPIVTVMGHVDHGKTSLLDALRGSDVVSGEAGGITQHIGAYRLNTSRADIVFLDTPGHAAFAQMRARGAQCTDIVVLVVAADDGVMPQTDEAIAHAKDSGVPIVVALNKIDLPNANADRILGELADRGLVAESWGGDTIVVETSATRRLGIDELLENLALQAELLELKANPNRKASGAIIESRMDKSRGPICTALIQEGTMRGGEAVVIGEVFGKIRTMRDFRGESIKEAGPSTPVEISGISGVPLSGDILNVVADEKDARALAEHRRKQSRRKGTGSAGVTTTQEDFLGALSSDKLAELKLLVKADVHGSSEAIKESLLKLGTDRVRVNVIGAGVGGIHETDVNLAKASGALVIGFNVRVAAKAAALAERQDVEVKIYDVIYELLDDAKLLMRGLLPKKRTEIPIGRAEVRQTFTIPRVGTIGGCAVIEGRIIRNSRLRLIRNEIKIYDGKVSSLKRFREDVREVAQGYECGIGIEGYNQLEKGDVIEAYEVEETTPELGF